MQPVTAPPDPAPTSHLCSCRCSPYPHITIDPSLPSPVQPGPNHNHATLWQSSNQSQGHYFVAGIFSQSKDLYHVTTKPMDAKDNDDTDISYSSSEPACRGSVPSLLSGLLRLCRFVVRFRCPLRRVLGVLMCECVYTGYAEPDQFAPHCLSTRRRLRPQWKAPSPRAPSIPELGTTKRMGTHTCPGTLTTPWGLHVRRYANAWQIKYVGPLVVPLKRCKMAFYVVLRGTISHQIVAKEKEAAEWQRKYEESRQEVVEMRQVFAFNWGGFVNLFYCLITTDFFLQTWLFYRHL